MSTEHLEQERIDRRPMITVLAATGFAWFGCGKAF
jgi:hypothetical protein